MISFNILIFSDALTSPFFSFSVNSLYSLNLRAILSLTGTYVLKYSMISCTEYPVFSILSQIRMPSSSSWPSSFGGMWWVMLRGMVISTPPLFTVCISSSILRISPRVGEECLDQFLLGMFEEEAELAADGFLVGSFESMLTSDILLESPLD